MKKLVILLVAFIALSMISGTVSAKNVKAEAKAGVESVKGKIISIDTAKNVIVVKDIRLKAERVIMVDAKTISTLKVGEIIKAEVKSDSNEAESIKVLPQKTK